MSVFFRGMQNAAFSLLITFFLIVYSSCKSTSQINTGLEQIQFSSSKKDSLSTAFSDTLKPQMTSDTIIWYDSIDVNTKLIYTKVGTNISIDTLLKDSLRNELDFNQPDSSIVKRNRYSIALLMPFRSAGFVPSPTKEIPTKSIKSVEFYEGLLIALDSLKKKGLKLDLHVFDTNYDTLQIDSILSKEELINADVIIGPYFSSSLSRIAAFALKNRIIHISPFNSKEDLVKNNPYFLQMNPSFKRHCEFLYKQLKNIDSDPKLFRTPLEKHLLIFGQHSDSSKIESLQEAYINFKNDTSANINSLCVGDELFEIDLIEKHLNKDKLNIIIIPSRNEAFVYNTMREIQKLVDKVEPKKGYQINIIGTDSWKYFTRVNFEYFESLNLHFSSETFVDTEADPVLDFQKAYKNKFGIAPREFGYAGYDIMMYTGLMLQSFGRNFITHSWKIDYPAYLQNSITIRAEIKSTKEIDEQSYPIISHFENQRLNFIKFKNYSFQKLN